MHGQSGGVEIETARLMLRSYRADDHPSVHAIFSDPDMFHYSHRGAMSSEESWSLLLRQIGHWSAFGYGVFAAVERDSRRLVGEAGLSDYRRRLGPDFDPYPEATWSIVPDAQGQGYAIEAAAAALDWIESRNGVRRTVCLIHEGNAPSLAVAARLGYEPFSRLTYRGYPAVLMARERGAP